MRLLWVEDNITETKSGPWFASIKKSCEIVEATDYNVARNNIETELELYDLIVLDINLKESLPTRSVEAASRAFGLTEEKFLEEAGFHLFIQLLELGFPKDRIIFFTGNFSEIDLQLYLALDDLWQTWYTDDIDRFDDILYGPIQASLDPEAFNHAVMLAEAKDYSNLFVYLEKKAEESDNGNNDTYNTFKKRFREARIRPSKAIWKSDNEQNALSLWAAPHLQNPYLRLRRGIIDGCQHLRKLLSDDPTSLRTDEFVPNSSTSYVVDYLRVLEQFLPMQKPANPAALYKLFIRTLAHEWDNCNPWKLKPTIFNEDKQIFLAFAKIMKTTRNWMAHSQVFDNVKEQHIAYLFLISMRVLFDLPPTTQAYETILLQLFKGPLTPEEFSTITGKDAKERNITLVRYYIKIANKISSFDKQIEKATYFHDWLNNAQKSPNFVEKHQDILLTGLLQEFWYLTSHQYISKPKPTGSSIGIFYSFNYFNYNAKPWLQEFGQHFYRMSFPD